MHLNYGLDKIKFATDEATFKRAVGLYDSGKVREVQDYLDKKYEKGRY